jgi:hypothetical protein
MAALSLASGCAYLRAANATPEPMEGQLTATLRQADQEAVALRFGVADQLLAGFAQSHAGAPEAVETAFWRAVFKLDTANQTGSRRDAVALLDGYLNAPTAVAHRGAALALRRAASASERPVVIAPGPTTPATPSTAPSPRSEASAEEVQRLREELAKANAELERIRKRLSQPNP